MTGGAIPLEASPLRVLGVIPARGGSKGLPGKNVRPLAGLPLVGHALRCGALTSSVTRTVVSTDDNGIAAVARRLGGDVPFMRPSDLAGDATPMAPVLRHALERVEAEEGTLYDAVALFDPTSPCRVPEQIDSAVAMLFASRSLDGVVAVSEPHFNPAWVGVRMSTDGGVSRYFDGARGVTRRQDTERYLRVNGNFYVWRSDFVRRIDSSWLDEGQHAGYEIPELQAFSIDNEQEFKVLEAVIASGLISLPWLEGRAAK